MPIRATILTIVTATGLSACATTRTATVEERAYCERMAEAMGIGTTHDHAAMKGMPANGMNLTHERCQQILAKK